MTVGSTASLGALLLLAACGGATPVPVTADDPPPSSSASPEPTTPSALAARLAQLAAGADAASVDRYVDQAFAARLPSHGTLAAALGAHVEGCTPQLTESPGGSAIAIPPPSVDDSPNEAARVDAILDELAASTEVMATCTIEVSDDDEEATQREVALWVVAIRTDAQGTLRVLAWRGLIGER